MHLLILVLTHREALDDLMKALAEGGISGCTIIHSKGMRSVIENYEDLPMFGILRHLQEEEEREENRTIFTVLNDEDLAKAKEIIHKVLGDLNRPNAGIMFSLPVDFVEGVGAK